MKFIPTFSLTALLTLCAFGVSAQSMALVNGVATKVQVAGNDLAAIYDDVPSYMDGFEADTGGVFQKVTPRIGPQPEALVSSDIVRTNPSPEIKVNSDYMFNFEGSSVKLTESNKKVISEFASKIKSGAAESIQLSCSHKSNDLSGKNTSQARVDAVKAYLQTLGVSPNVILTTLVEGGNADNHGAVNFLLKK